MLDSRIYRHPKRPDWGMAVASEEVEDLVRFVFEDTHVRAFKARNLQVLEVVEMSDEAAAELRSKLIRKKPAASTAARKKAKAAAAKPAVAAIAVEK